MALSSAVRETKKEHTMSWAQDSPIIRSLLDTDFYKFTMGQLVFRSYSDTEVTFSLVNRSKAPLSSVIPEEELRRELDRIRTLRFTNSELHYLRGTNEYCERMFGEDYLEFLRNLELPPYDLWQNGDGYHLNFRGLWPTVMFWEVPALAVVNELYFRNQIKAKSRFERDTIYAKGIQKLLEKIRTIRNYPDISFSDFGTRRRFGFGWQDYVVGSLREELPRQFRGTSNVYLAMKHGLLPMGTSAHELPMVIAARYFSDEGNRGLPDSEVLKKAQDEVLNGWYGLYGNGLSIALTDTFGSDFFFRTAPASVARDWKGTRQDSGDPFEYGEKAIAWYKAHGVNPAEKVIVFSDQLTVGLARDLHLRFRGRIGQTFGIGTNLTNDLCLEPVSMVIKAAQANGRSTVKLSDNLAKAMGEPNEVERYKHAAGYVNTVNIPCIS